MSVVILATLNTQNPEAPISAYPFPGGSLNSSGNDGRGCSEHDESAGQNGGFERSSGGVGWLSGSGLEV